MHVGHNTADKIVAGNR